MPVSLTTIFSVVIILGVFALVSLSIYKKIRQIWGKKKEIKSKEDKNNIGCVFNNNC
ncbi:MAG: hypothetical protein OHM56_05785 [Spiroplasma phoeniceum]|nr:MAG: hypothetical protein OHM57_05185 [Spiroplasma phoeniceum]UZQ33431.1 MAG: hypothetical protein OHM56_05785 [Spiroplasma phoeniceum]